MSLPLYYIIKYVESFTGRISFSGSDKSMPLREGFEIVESSICPLRNIGPRLKQLRKELKRVQL